MSWNESNDNLNNINNNINNNIYDYNYDYNYNYNYNYNDDTDTIIKDFLGYKNQNIINNNSNLCNTCNLVHPLNFFVKSKKYCYNCWGCKNVHNFDLEFGKYIKDDENSVPLSEAIEILKTVLQFYDRIDNKYKMTESIFTKVINYEELGILHNQFSKLIYKKNKLVFIGNKHVKIDYKNAVIYI